MRQKTNAHVCAFLLATSAVLGLHAEAKAASDAGQIDTVVVYGDRAQVTREKVVTCKNGEANTTFFPLPVSMAQDTIKAHAHGKAEAIGTVVSRRNLAADEEDARLKAAREKLETLSAQMRTVRDAQARDKARLQALRGYEEQVRDDIAEASRDGKPNARRWTAALDTVRKERIAAAERAAEHKQALRRLRAEQHVVEQELQLLSTRLSEEGMAVDVAVACTAGRTKVQVSYVVPGATWRPEYDVRYKGAIGKNGTVDVTVSAVVQQQTGEDWNGATLVLSSAQPWLGLSAPKPRRLTVVGGPDKSGKVLVHGHERRDNLKAGNGGGKSGPTAAALQDGGQSVTLTLPRRVSVQSDGRPYWMPVDNLRTKASAGLVAVPKRSDHVYQVVRFQNPAAYPLLAGRAHMHRAGGYVGDVSLRHFGPGEPIELSLGIDEELKVKRKSLIDRRESARFLSQNQRLKQAFEVTIENQKTQTVHVELRENLPVSEMKEIGVTLLPKKTTSGYAHDKKRGMLTWKLTVKSGARATVNLGYDIKLPKDWKM